MNDDKIFLLFFLDLRDLVNALLISALESDLGSNESSVFSEVGLITVSYTHLRAHETV